MPVPPKSRYAAISKPSDSRVITHPWLASGGVSIERLATFIKIAAAGSIAAAAEGDLVRQSQFSRQLSELESALGSPLFVRGRNRSWNLTITGSRLFEILNHFFGDLSCLVGQRENEKPEISFGAGESFLQWIFLQRKVIAHEQFTFRLENLQSQDIAKRLEDGRLDLGILPEVEVPGIGEALPLGTLRQSLFVPASLLKSPPRQASTKALPKRIVLAATSAKAADSTRRALPEIEITVGLICSSMPQIVSALAAGEAFAAVLPSVVKCLLPATVLELQPSSMRSLGRKLVLVHHKRAHTLRPEVAKLARRLRDKLALI